MRRAFLSIWPLLVACTSSGGSGGGTPPPTAVAVDPARFLGDVPCGDEPDSLVRYVATLSDVSTLNGSVEEFPLPSSLPTPCNQDVRFERVVAGRMYVADIQGYDRADIEEMEAGSAIMLDTNTGAYVPPRWTASCGREGFDPVAYEESNAALADGTDAQGIWYGQCWGMDSDGGHPPDLDGPTCSRPNITMRTRGCTHLFEVSPDAPAP